MKDPIIMIGGPTAVGKSALAIALAKQFAGEVVNADAYQIYRGMDIGTAKVMPQEMAGVPHHLFDFVDPSTPYSVARFKQDAEKTIAAIHARHHLPIVVGGTGFYLSALLFNLPLGGEAPPSPTRLELQQELEVVGEKALWQRLAAQDPKAARSIPPGNSRRVIRALEVMATTGTLFSQQPQRAPAYDALVLGLTTDREALYQRINQRVVRMVQAGLVAEVRRVVSQAGADAQALQAIGYKELVPYLTGTTSLEQAIAAIQQHSRRYAKRQLTYFRHQLPTQWFDLVQHPEELTQIEQTVAAFLKRRPT